MEICPVTDSASPIPNEPKKCPTCGSALRLEDALCLNCLLRFALQDDAVASSKATFKNALAAIDPQATNWRIGDYEILDEIGRGGMGVIYRAREPHSRRIVALKCVLGYHVDSDQTLARFRREAETAARLDHPNIIPIYHVGESALGLPFFTMKLASGGSLVQARTSLQQEPRQSVCLMAKVALALQYAHEQGVLHRDLKPGNILLDHRWEPLVGDFGLAKWQETSSNLTRSLTIFGTPGYIAPEQAEGPATQLTAAADIYSLGAILFELLTGRPPFLGEHALAVIRQALERVAPRVRSVAPHLDRDLETMCARCLERDPSARYHSCQELAQDLQSWLDNRPIRARSAGIVVRISRWFCRNRMLGGTIAVSCLLAAASLFWLVYGWQLQSAILEITAAKRSVLVMPFLNLDKLAPDFTLAQSMTTSLKDGLDRLGPAQVRAMRPDLSFNWTGADELRKAAESANARTVLTGTVRTVQGKKRISLRLLGAAAGEPLFVRVWDDSGQKDPLDPVGKQVIPQVYNILSSKDWSDRIQSKADPGLRNQSSGEAILAGRELMARYTITDLDRAIDLFKKAVQMEPDSWVAHSYFSFATTARTHYVADWSYLKIGMDEAARAVQLAPTSGEAHRALAGVLYQEGLLAEALEEGMQTIEISGVEEKVAHLMGMTFDTLGRPDYALNWLTFASRLRGTSGNVEAHIGDCWVKLGDDQRARDAYTRSVELQPDRPQGIVGICHMRILEGDFEMARKAYRTGYWNHDDLNGNRAIAAQIELFARNFESAEKLYNALAAADPDGGGAFYGAVSYQSALARAKQALGDPGGAKQLLDRCFARETAAIKREPENPEAMYRLAAVESSLGQLDHSIDHLHAAVRLGWIDYRSLAMDPRFDAIRPTPVFQRIVNNLFATVAAMRSKITN